MFVCRLATRAAEQRRRFERTCYRDARSVTGTKRSISRTADVMRKPVLVDTDAFEENRDKRCTLHSTATQKMTHQPFKDDENINMRK